MRLSATLNTIESEIRRQSDKIEIRKQANSILLSLRDGEMSFTLLKIELIWLN